MYPNDRWKFRSRPSWAKPVGGFSALELLLVVAIVIIVAGMAIPKLMSMVQNLRTAGDARDLNGVILMAKMRAASNFAQARVHADLNTQTFWVEVEQSGATSWTPEGGTQLLSTGVTFGFGSLSTPPSNTQATLAQAPACPGISNTACVVFNSRGIPVDSTNTPTGNDALYVTDGTSVTGVTVLATGLTQIWRSDASTANWITR
jgi:type II secretory pathway pseudopilin PulG